MWRSNRVKNQNSIRSSDLLPSFLLQLLLLLFRYKGDTISRAARARVPLLLAATACCLPTSHCDHAINNVQPLILLEVLGITLF